MKQFLFIFLFGFGLSLFAQDTTYYDRAEDKVLSLDSAYRYLVKTKNTFRVFLRDGRIVLESYQQKIKKRKYYVVKQWYASGGLKSESLHRKGSTNFSVTSYWPNGKVQAIQSADSYGLIEKKCKGFTKAGIDTIFSRYYQPPSFPGGKKQLKHFLNNYKLWDTPNKSDERTMKFIIEKDGSVSNVRLCEGEYPELDKEAYQLLSRLPKWLPGKILGVPVRVLVRLELYTEYSKRKRRKVSQLSLSYQFLVFEE